MNSNFDDVTILIPTLNEGGNIGRLLGILTKEYDGISIIVSDDGSKDKTCDIVKYFSLKNNKIMLLDRKNKKIKGLTVSVIDGIKKTRTQFFIVMDGDLQHPPKKARDIIEKLRKGYNLVIGCRKKVSSEWPWYRILMSRFATFIGRVKIMLKGRKTKDIMSGFFGGETVLIRNLINNKYEKFELTGYKILFDILDIYPDKLAMCDIYYDFNIREHGKSKIGKKQIISYTKSIFRI